MIIVAYLTGANNEYTIFPAPKDQAANSTPQGKEVYIPYAESM